MTTKAVRAAGEYEGNIGNNRNYFAISIDGKRVTIHLYSSTETGN
jgi:hypothetical protein